MDKDKKLMEAYRRHRNICNLMFYLPPSDKWSGTVSHLPTCLFLWLAPSLTPRTCAEQLGVLKAELSLVVKDSEDQV